MLILAIECNYYYNVIKYKVLTNITTNVGI